MQEPNIEEKVSVLKMNVIALSSYERDFHHFCFNNPIFLIILK